MSVTWNQSSLACVSSSNSKIPLDLNVCTISSISVSWRFYSFFYGFVFVYTYVIPNLFFKYLTKNANSVDMCVCSFMNTGIFLENRSGIHCFKTCLSLTLHYEAMWSQSCNSVKLLFCSYNKVEEDTIQPQWPASQAIAPPSPDRKYQNISCT